MEGLRNMDSGNFCEYIWGAIQQGSIKEIQRELQGFYTNPDIPNDLRPLIPKLQAIINGAREVNLAEDDNLAYRDQAELLLLMERLGAMG